MDRKTRRNWQSTKLMGNFYIPLSQKHSNKSSGNMNKNENLENTINKFDTIDMCMNISNKQRIDMP